MKTRLPSLRPFAALALLCLATGCVSHRHVVGLGGSDTKQVRARQYYAFFGLVPVGEVDTQRLAPDLTSYTVETRFDVVDALLAPFLLALTMTSRTVIVRT